MVVLLNRLARLCLSSATWFLTRCDRRVLADHSPRTEWRKCRVVLQDHLHYLFKVIHYLSLGCVIPICNKYKVRLGCFEDLHHFNNISVTSRLGGRRYPISEIEVVRLWFEPQIPCSTGQKLNHYTYTTALMNTGNKYQSFNMLSWTKANNMDKVGNMTLSKPRFHYSVKY